MSKEGGSQEFFEVFKRPDEIKSRKDSAPEKEKKKKIVQHEISSPPSDKLEPSIEPSPPSKTVPTAKVTEERPSVDEKSKLPQITITLTQMQCVLMSLLIFISWALMFIFGQMTAHPRSRVIKESRGEHSTDLSLDARFTTGTAMGTKKRRKANVQRSITFRKGAKWTVRVVSYKPNSKYINRTIASLSKAYREYKNEIFMGRDGKMIVIYIGKFDSEQKAKELKEKLQRVLDTDGRQSYPDCQVKLVKE